MMEDDKLSAAAPQYDYTPTELISSCQASMVKNDGSSDKVIQVKGVYSKCGMRPYGTWWYDELKDENLQTSITVVISSHLRDTLANNNLTILGGTLIYKADSHGKIQLQLNVTRVPIIEKEIAIDAEDEKRQQLRQNKVNKGYKNVAFLLEQKIYAGERPKVALIYAGASITDADFKAGLDAAQTAIDFTETRVSFAATEELTSLLIRMDGEDYDVLCLIRGGGTGVEVLDKLPVLQCAASLNTALIVAVGHVEERLFIKTVADYEAPVPHGLGTWFANLVERVAQQKSTSLAAVQQSVRQQYEEQIKVYEAGKKQSEQQIRQLTDTQKAYETRQKGLDEQMKILQNQCAQSGKLYEQISSQKDKLSVQSNKIITMQKQLDYQRRKINRLTTTLLFLLTMCIFIFLIFILNSVS